MSTLTIIKATRPNFLVLAPLCGWLGIILAWRQTDAVSVTHILLVIIGALLAHAAVNLLNEYEDFRSGLDLMTVRTPFSGGSGALPEEPKAAPQVLIAAVSAIAGVAAIGLYFLWLRGIPMLWPGLLGLLLVIGYTRWITRSPLLCLLAPGLGFGPAMILGTQVALGGTPTVGAVLVSTMAMLLVSELLLINQFPDVDPDRRVGRRHLPIVTGLKRSAAIVSFLLLGTFLTLLVAVASGVLPLVAGLAFLALPGALWVVKQLPQTYHDNDALSPVLGINVATILGFLALLGTGLTIGL